MPPPFKINFCGQERRMEEMREFVPELQPRFLKQSNDSENILSQTNQKLNPGFSSEDIWTILNSFVQSNFISYKPSQAFSKDQEEQWNFAIQTFELIIVIICLQNLLSCERKLPKSSHRYPRGIHLLAMQSEQSLQVSVDGLALLWKEYEIINSAWKPQF